MARDGRDDDATQPHPALKLALSLCVAAAAAAGIYATNPPPALDATAPAEAFSAARAKLHLQEIAREPHPIGTEANHRVRDYLLQQLTVLGAEVSLETAVGITNSDRVIYAGTAQNIIAIIRGTDSRRAVMLSSHYDSVPQAPGAADAGAGVAGILEVIRALQAGPPLKNDVLVLYTDGEEEGLLGAAAFVRDHPELVRRIGVVLNFEARGSSGPALMFETSDQNGWLTREFARAAPHPVGSSLAYAVYKELPNDTDMTVFKRAGLAGLNFAFSGTVQNYHTARDTAENLDSRSLQHLGANALALTRHFGNAELEQLRQGDRVFFNWFGSWLIHYPGWVVWPLLALGVVLLAGAVASGVQRRLITAGRAAVGLLGFLLLLLATLAGAYFTWWLIRFTSADRLLLGDTWSNTLLVLGCLAMALAFSVVLQARLVSKLGRFNVAAGQLLGFAIVTAIVTIRTPAASYLFQWPLLFAALGLLAAILARKPNGSAVCAGLGTLPAVFLFAPLGYLLFVLLGLNSIAVAALAVLLGCFLAAAAPFFAPVGKAPRVTVASLLIASIALGLVGRQLSQFSAAHPQRNSLIYSVNADERKATWISSDDAVDGWTAQFLGNNRQRGEAAAFQMGSERNVWSAEAELLPLQAPTATVISDSAEGDERVLRLHLASPRNANVLLMRLPANAKVLSLVANGRSHRLENADAAASSWLFRYNAPPPEGVDLELWLASSAPLKCWVADRSLGLPEIPNKTYRLRAAEYVATYGSDVMLVARQYTF